MAHRRIDLTFASLAEAADDVRFARRQGYELTGNWSLAQILQHLNLAMRMTFGRTALHAAGSAATHC